MKNIVLKILATLIAVICIVLVAVMIIKNVKNKKEVPSNNELSIYEVKDINQMKEYLGYYVPIVDNKSIYKFLVMGTGDNKNHGRVIYTDGSQMDMEKSNVDISGISGGEILSNKLVNNVMVSIYIYNDTLYATWIVDEYSYAYSVNDKNEEHLINDLNVLMQHIR